MSDAYFVFPSDADRAVGISEATQGRLNAAPERRRNLRPSGRGGCQGLCYFCEEEL